MRRTVRYQHRPDLPAPPPAGAWLGLAVVVAVFAGLMVAFQADTDASIEVTATTAAVAPPLDPTEVLVDGVRVPPRCEASDVAVDFRSDAVAAGLVVIVALENTGGEACHVDGEVTVVEWSLDGGTLPGGLRRQAVGLYGLHPGTRLVLEGIWAEPCERARPADAIRVNAFGIADTSLSVAGGSCFDGRAGWVGPVRATSVPRPEPSCSERDELALIGPLVGAHHETPQQALAATLGGSPGFDSGRFGVLASLGPGDFLLGSNGAADAVEYTHSGTDLAVAVRAHRDGGWGIDLVIVSRCR